MVACCFSVVAERRALLATRASRVAWLVVAKTEIFPMYTSMAFKTLADNWCWYGCVAALALLKEAP